MNIVERLKRIDFRELLTMSEPDLEVRQARIHLMERNVMLPVKVVVIVILFYYLFFSHWFDDVTNERDAALELVRSMFLVCFIINLGVASLLIGMAQVPFRLIHWLVFTNSLIDGVFLAALTLVTGGFDSPLFWLFLVLIVRNAFSMPVATPQIIMNVTVSLAYLLAGLLDMALTQTEIEAAKLPVGARLNILSPLPETGDPAEPFMIRMCLLGLMTACCYGVQVLFDKQRRAEAEAREFIVRQEQLRTAGRLAAEIAHQIKNPLGIINNAAYTLQRTVKEGKKTITQQIQIIREEVERSDRIITELMGYAQLTEGKVEKLNVVEELDRAIDRVFPVAVKYETQILRNYSPALPELLMQRNNLSEIFANILQNAREALNGKGTVQVSAQFADNYCVMVSISDNGPGISEELREKIFEPYFTTKEKGTGLGLAIVKHNTEMYGGSVRLESELGKGTRFVLIFPARTVMKLRR